VSVVGVWNEREGDPTGVVAYIKELRRCVPPPQLLA
jgi:hypothetical protein